MAIGLHSYNEDLAEPLPPIVRGCLRRLDRPRPTDDDQLMSLASIQREILRLDSEERAMLIDLIWESLDEARIKEIEAKWASESEDRIDAVDQGEMSTVDGPTALRDLRSSLLK